MEINPSNPVHERLNRIESILPSLGQELLKLQSGELGVITKSNSFDLLTKADTASETRLVGGIVSAPGMGLCYRAAKGCGATCNGQSISVNKKADMGDGIIATGFPYDRAKRAEPICRALENMLRQAGGIRRLGAASLDFCFLADGRFTGYYEMGLKPWDYAAGSLVAQEAGAKVTNLSGEPLDIFNSTGVVVTNGSIHDELLLAARPMIEAAAL